MKRLTLSLLTAGFALLAARANLKADIIYQATAATIPYAGANYTFINDPYLNGHPNRIVLVTQLWNPSGGSSGVYNPHAVGVFYHYGVGKWAIFNEYEPKLEKPPAMPLNASYFVYSSLSSSNAFVHSATSDNTSRNYTYITNPNTDGHPEALLFLTQNWNPPGSGGVYNNQNTAVIYNSTRRKWAIYNLGGKAMPIGAAFNIVAMQPSSCNISTHYAGPDNVDGNSTFLDCGPTDTMPGEVGMFQVAPNLTPNGCGTGLFCLPGLVDDNPYGVWYDPANGKWAIFNEDSTVAMPQGSVFNIFWERVPG